MRVRVTPIILAGALGVAAQAQPSGRVPIAPGLYAQAEEGCARATYVTTYQEGSWGNIALGGPDYPGSSNIYQIRRVAPGRNGYTSIWWDQDSSRDGDLMLRPLDANRFVHRTISYGSGHVGGRVDVSDTIYVRCAFDRLPPRMQAAIRQHHPQLAPGRQAASAAAPAGIPAPVAPFNIRPGHYVPVQEPCASPTAMIFYYDGRRLGWIDMQPFNPSRLDPVAGARRTATGWQHLGERVRVLAPDRIASSDPNTGDETLRWCPAHEVRASARSR